jgi:hypothetical protein
MARWSALTGWYSTPSRSDYTMLLIPKGQVDQGTTQCTLGASYSTYQPTGQLPYFLVYGSEAILPVDVMWESLTVEQYDKGISEDNRRVNIDSLEETCCTALVQSARYLEGIRRYHDRNIKERYFNIGDLVLHRIQNKDGLHKLSSPWEGPSQYPR